jgi:hypothetical protein
MSQKLEKSVLKIEVPNSRRPHTIFRICAENQTEEDVALIGGGLYPDADLNPDKYYSVWWTALSNANAFLKTVEGFKLPVVKTDPIDQGFINADNIYDEEFQKYWHEGILIYTDKGCAWCNLNEGLSNLPALKPETIQDRLAQVFNLDVGTPIQVKSYRINTSVGDFAIDLVKDDDEDVPLGAVLSHLNLSKEIAQMAVQTGGLQLGLDSLIQNLDSILNRFPPRET